VEATAGLNFVAKRKILPYRGSNPGCAVRSLLTALAMTFKVLYHTFGPYEIRNTENLRITSKGFQEPVALSLKVPLRRQYKIKNE
jgi:hypothetical protein